MNKVGKKEKRETNGKWWKKGMKREAFFLTTFRKPTVEVLSCKRNYFGSRHFATW